MSEHPDMVVGSQYVVLEIEFADGGASFLRLLDPGKPPDDLPGLWWAEMFEVLDPRIPSTWEAHIGGSVINGYVKLAPESWHRPGFWEDLDEYSELSERAFEDYHREVERILRESLGQE